ncbi:hypothetical protein [Aquipseudomonas campi]
MNTKVHCKSCDSLILQETASKNNGLCFPCKNGTRSLINEWRKISSESKQPAVESEFICLECGSKNSIEQIHVGVKYIGENPWSYVAARERCGNCEVILPRALARRWNNESLEQAREIWLLKYKTA